jgi:hypothetical protein
MNQVITIGFDNNKGVSANDWFFAIWVSLQRLAIAGCFPFGALTIESLGPGYGIVGTVSATLNAAGHAHVVNLADPSRIVAIVLEVLRPSRPVADLGARTLVSQYARCVRIVT